MRKLLIPVLAATVLATWVPTAASAGDARQDAYYTVMCTTDTGELVAAESVDAHAIEQGGKAAAIAHFSANYPFGWTCWFEGPFRG